MKRIFIVINVVLGFSLLQAGLVSAQQAKPAETACRQSPPKPIPPIPPVPPIPPIPPIPLVGFAKLVFPVNLIMQHARALGLTAEQRAFMTEEIQTTTKRFNELQWQLHDALEALTAAVKLDVADEQETLTLLDKVLAHEREIKRLHLTMGIRIRNKLTREQRAKLQVLRTPKRNSHVAAEGMLEPQRTPN